MCMKTPKPKKVEEKPVQWLRNPLLDGLAIGRGQTKGRTALRNDLGSAGAAYVNPYVKTPAPAAIAPTSSPTAGAGTGLAIPTAPRGGGGRRVNSNIDLR